DCYCQTWTTDIDVF
nr:immunoglobulin light chain junction region [Macaca mulatta]MOY06052.1 immunoglobulin light chain junction region [Macaca mulatta]MOY08970.1 immunoglobulin light chain junction region [Macaca mulatta]MOY09340.1 immunoglobulin light chain junction region [Macaca mulatta]